MNSQKFWSAKVAPFKQLSKEFLIIILGKVVALILTIVGLKYTTSLIGPSVYGKFSLFLTVTTLGELLFGTMGQGVGRFFFEAKQKNEFHILRHLTIDLIKKIVWVLVATIPIWFYFFNSWFIAVLLPFFSTITGITGILSGLQNSQRHRMIVVAHEVGDKILKFGGLIFVGLYLPITDKSMMLAYTVAALVVVISQWYFYRSKIEKILLDSSVGPIDPVIRRRYLSNVWMYCYPFLTWVIFAWVQNSSDRWVLITYMSSVEVGLYQVLNQYGFQLISIGVGMIATLITPILFEKAAHRENTDSILQTVRLNIKISYAFGGFIFGASFVSFFIHDFIFSLVVGVEYRQVSYLFPIMMLGGGFFAIGQLLCSNFMINFNPEKIILPKIFNALFGVFASVILVQYLGLKGVVISLVISQFIFMMWLLFLSQKFIK